MPARSATERTNRLRQANPNRCFPLQATSSIAQNAIKNGQKKRGPKPKPLSERVRNWQGPAKKVERSYDRDKKLRIIGYWLYALVPDERYGI